MSEQPRRALFTSGTDTVVAELALAVAAAQRGDEVPRWARASDNPVRVPPCPELVTALPDAEARP